MCKKTIKVFYLGVIMIFIPGRAGYGELKEFSSKNGNYEVTGKPEPIKAAPGENVTLPCWVYPEWDATEETVQWSRQDQTQDSDKKYVLVDKGSGPDTDQMMESYIGRATLCSKNRKTGNVSLNIKNVNVSDSGWFKCFLPELNKYAKVKLDVEWKFFEHREPNNEKKGIWNHLYAFWGFLLLIFILLILLCCWKAGPCRDIWRVSARRYI